MFRPKITPALRETWKALGPDSVVVHMMPRAKPMPSASAFILKLETYLRMANVEYKPVTKSYPGPKGKVPWVTIGGDRDMSDSQFIIEHFEETRGRLNTSLSPEQAAVARTLQVALDDRFYWLVLLDLCVVNECKDVPDLMEFPSKVPKFLHGPIMNYLVKALKKQTYQHGVGRHSHEELKALTLGDLKAFSNLLDDKQYLFGSSPSVADCSLFGHVAVAYFQNKDGHYIREAIKGDCGNLLGFIERTKEKYWPDWEECCYKPRKKSTA